MRLIMPRVCGESTTSTVWLRHFNPSPRTVARCSSLRPLKPRTSVTRSFFCPAMFSSLSELLDRHPALGGDVGGGVAVLERVERRAHDVVGVGRAVALGQYVRDADYFEYGAHRPAGDDAGAV